MTSAATLPVANRSCVASPLANSAQPGMPRLSSGSGRLRLPQFVRDRPNANRTAVVAGTGATSTVRSLPGYGRSSLPWARTGTPALPAQPVPNGTQAPGATGPYSQVSANDLLPKRTVRPRAASNARTWSPSTGGLDAVARWVQSVPSHSHVSWSGPENGAMRPPNSTVRPRSETYASACCIRAGGAWVPPACDQFVPSHSHVSDIQGPL